MAPRTRNTPKKKYKTVQSVTEKLARKQVLDKLCHDAITAQANSKNNKLPLGYFKHILENDEFNVKKEGYNWYKVSSFKHHLYALKNKKITPADNPDGHPPPPPPLSNKEKHTILDGRVDRCLNHMELVPTDIMPMINKAWPVSFGCEITNKKAICDRGWYPYNRNLLNNEDLSMKMTKEDKKNENENILFAHLKEQKQIATIVTPPPPPLPSIHLNVNQEASVDHALNIL